jgi:ATP-binding cassette, subfamily D (ALD), peroxisomal long-chain fatty acid import protein
VYRGLVSRPRSTGSDGIMFLPQRPYLSIGTLRDQVIYPDGEADMRDKGRRDIELRRILEDARLGYLPDREGGWDTRKEWKDVLSGGEKQRMAIARLLYHEPRYAFIDEGTSAVSSDVEGYLYEVAKERGITLITISTRASLKKYHTFNLTLGLGDDGMEWVYERVGSEAQRMGVERELRELRDKLAQVEGWRSRRDEIEKELGRVWVQGGEELRMPGEEDERIDNAEAKAEVEGETEGRINVEREVGHAEAEPVSEAEVDEGAEKSTLGSASIVDTMSGSGSGSGSGSAISS